MDGGAPGGVGWRRRAPATLEEHSSKGIDLTGTGPGSVIMAGWSHESCSLHGTHYSVDLRCNQSKIMCAALRMPDNANMDDIR